MLGVKNERERERDTAKDGSEREREGMFEKMM